ncbi:MAG: ABC transporter permease [Azospirillaceae bacterium]|nr:ABC transporter permease [Azospirillaceae bacterium]
MTAVGPGVMPAHPRSWRLIAAARPATVIAGLVLVAAVLVAVLAPWLSQQNPYDLAQLDVIDAHLPPGSAMATGTARYWLGTDPQGRDMLSAIFYGLRTSLLVASVSTTVALLFGMVTGLLAAFARSWVDAAIMRLVDLQLSFPAILIALILLGLLGQGVDKVILALIAVQWAYFARTVRASALVERGKDYVQAAAGLGLAPLRIALGHLLPNCLPPLLVIVPVQAAHAITLEATLSFLGVGVPVTEPSLGMLIAGGYDYLLSGEYWISLFPGIALVLVIGAINIVGDGLQDWFHSTGER